MLSLGVDRLKKTWEAVPKADEKTLQELKLLFSSEYVSYNFFFFHIDALSMCSYINSLFAFASIYAYVLR